MEIQFDLKLLLTLFSLLSSTINKTKIFRQIYVYVSMYTIYTQTQNGTILISFDWLKFFKAKLNGGKANYKHTRTNTVIKSTEDIERQQKNWCVFYIHVYTYYI